MSMRNFMRTLRSLPYQKLEGPGIRYKVPMGTEDHCATMCPLEAVHYYINGRFEASYFSARNLGLIEDAWDIMRAADDRTHTLRQELLRLRMRGYLPW